ncbi:MAG: hypothetical protein IT529_19155 [Burkholderiales bacterium]|nr:hypothetical protein [Burkholderiales bacterium]
MKVAALIKQIPAVESLKLDREGRLVRAGVVLEMNAYCRRAVSLAIMLSARTAGRCTVLTLAPESGEEVIRDALAAGADDGILISDPAFSGSDTLATARALAAALRKIDAVDLVTCGLNSVDADIGIVGDWRDVVPLLAPRLVSRDLTASARPRAHACRAEPSRSGA